MRHRDSGCESEVAMFDRQSSCMYEQLLESLYDGVYFVDKDRVINYWNSGAERISGYPGSEAVGRKCSDNFLRHVDDEGKELCVDGCPLLSTLGDGVQREAELYLQHKNGHRLPVWVRVSPIKDGQGNITGAVEVFSDASSKKRVERRANALRRLAFNDTLTRLPNRRYTELKLTQALQEVKQLGRRIGFLFIDLDHFKAVNDNYGHTVGDLVLRAVGATLSSTLRPNDLVGRWGGEEFVALLADISPSECDALAKRCCRILRTCVINAEECAVSITVSIGATIVRHNDSLNSLLRRVDGLMYTSKAAGRDRVTTVP
jgi:diguanylate cyclase (GGDEF)-like protein/PAS domain S-box-containing protein